MTRVCTACSHPARAEIDQALVNGGTSLRSLAASYGLSLSAVARHKDKHLPETLALAQEAAEVAHADDLLGQVRDLQERTLAVLGEAEKTGDLRVALRAIAEARQNTELLGKLLVAAAALAPEPVTVEAIDRAIEELEQELARRGASRAATLTDEELRQAIHQTHLDIVAAFSRELHEYPDPAIEHQLMVLLRGRGYEVSEPGSAVIEAPSSSELLEIPSPEAQDASRTRSEAEDVRDRASRARAAHRTAEFPQLGPGGRARPSRRARAGRAPGRPRPHSSPRAGQAHDPRTSRQPTMVSERR
jgi:hypothetical protein